MTPFAWLRAHRKSAASTGAITATVLAVTSFAMLYQGEPTTEVDLNDGGVWVTKQSSLLVGRFNYESTVLDSGLRTSTDKYDILQSGDVVVMVDQAGSTMTTIDPAQVLLTDSAELPAGATTALGGQTLAVLEPEKGSLWVLPAAGIGKFTAAKTDPVAELGAGAAVAVGLDGTVYAASAENRQLVTVPVDAQGEPGDPRTSGLDALPENPTVQVTVVGGTAVVLDTRSGTLVSSGGLRAEIGPAEGAKLQQPSAATDAVAVATADALLRVGFDGSAPQKQATAGSGVPAQPVALAGCTYAVWSGSASFIRDCAGDADDVSRTVPGADPSAELRFRVNRDAIVLNDIVGGSAWMAADDLQQVDNWQDIIPPEGQTEENNEDTTEETVETTLPERSDVNTPPIAVDDEFGVRPGRTTVLPVLDNDSDADGDVLTVTLPDGPPALGEVQSINRGAGLQIAVPEDATGTSSFVYEVDDGRGGKDQATVRLSVRDWSVNSAPEQKRTTTLTVEAGGVITYNLLPDWIDPDGDDVFLQSVVPAPGDEVDFTPDGRVTYRSINGAQGRKDIEITVSDGSKAATGVLRLDVRPPGSTAPVTNADHVVTRAGVPVSVSPLLNDVSTGAEPLRLTRVDEVAGARITPDYAGMTFSFTADAVGVYYVQYLASAGSQNAPGIVRVDVQEAAAPDAPPIAVRDVALLPSAGEVLVDVLANDVDPAGGILVVQSVSVAPGTGVTASLIGNKTLRIADQASLSQQVTVAYTVSNGLYSARGEVVVIPVPGPTKLRPPVAQDDTAVVRAGDVVTIPVLANDYDPNGDTMRVLPDLVAPLPAPESGEIFVSENTVRFRASDQPGTVYATYEVANSTGQKDAGYITIQVLPVNPDTNQAPRPRDLEARVLAGSQTYIMTPLDGIDPDGDSVELIGLASAPSKGRIVETGSAFLRYEASKGASGTDTFTYRVRDNLGKEATATIRVGIAPTEARNQAPYAVKDAVVMRPGRSVAVPVMANDSDPDGDDIRLVSDGLIVPDVPGLAAEVLGDRVVVTAPSQAMETSLQYTIRDARGAESIAVLQITVDQNVPLSRPIARDDRIDISKVDGDTVDVEVLANDEDPDGTVAALTVTVADPNARVLADGVVRVTLGETERLLTYTITDEDGLAASAFVRVPALSALPPSLISTKPVEVRSGETIDIPLADHVAAAGGGRVVITEAARVSALNGNGSNLVKDQTTLTYTSAAGYYGPDAVTLEVTDGTGPDDPAGRKATVTIPITVLPPANQQPTFVAGAMSIAPGEDPTRLDLRALTTDPDEGDLDGMTYALVGGAPSGLTASIDRQALRVGAASGTAKGTQATLTVRISDGTTAPVEGSVVVTVAASTRPLATANEDVIPQANQGETTMVPVLANDSFNPFPDTPLKVVAAATLTGRGTAEVSGDRVAVTPAADFVGTMTVRYRIQDATKDPEREVDGLITLTVQGRPDAPGIPTVSSVQDRTVVLSWTPPVDNGASIQRYVVTSTRGDYEKTCASTTCTLDGLTNNVEYTFTVVAVNRVGESDPSLPSAPARPDARPDTPQPPTLVFGDRSLSVSWVTPSTPGSPVESYTLEISPAPPSGVATKTGVTGNTLVWDGLENGSAYQVRVRAHNRAPDPSSWSSWSATMVPARAPDPVAAPTTERLTPVGQQAQLRVNWTPPATNGDAISGYELQVLRGGSVVNTIRGIAGGAISQAVVVDASTTDYTFQLRASNKAGWGEWGPASAPRRAFTAPGQPGPVSAAPGDRQLQLTFDDAQGNGTNASEMAYEYSLNGGGWAALPGNRIVGGLANGQSYTVQVRAYANLDGVRYDGAPTAASAAQRPYGPVGTPGASASASGTSITYSWSAPAENGRAITAMQIRIDGGGWQGVGLSGSTSAGYGYSETHTIEVQAQDAAGQWSPIAAASARTVDPPQPRVWVTRGAPVSGCSTNSLGNGCFYYMINTSNFAGGSYRFECYDVGGRFGNNQGYAINIPSNGQVQAQCYSGYAGNHYVRIIGGNPEYSESSVW